MNALDARVVRKLPTMFWARTVQHKMGGMSYGKIQKKLQVSSNEKNEFFWDAYSRRFYKYAKGTGIRDKRFINLVESHVPGTKQILLHPLWDILRHPEASLEDIFHYMNNLDFNLRKKLFTTDRLSKALVRKKLQNLSQVYYVAVENNLDALACLLMFIREAEINKQVQAYITCKWEVVYLIYRLAICSPYQDVMYVLHEVVFRLFIGKNHPLPSEFVNAHWDDYPFDRDIPTNNPFYVVKDIYSGVLWNAENRKVISSDEQKKLKFLFWVDHFFNKNELKRALIRLPSDFDITQPSSSFPPPLNKLMEILRGDSRKYLLGGGEFLF